VSSAQADAAAQNNAAPPDYVTDSNATFIFFRNQSNFSLTNSALFGSFAELSPTLIHVPRATSSSSHIPWRARSRFALYSSQSARQTSTDADQQHSTLPTVSRALLLAQNAAAALCDPEMDEDTFSTTIASALAEASRPAR
jgi:hypothetical protein